jgi:hypothetical protein
MSKTAEPTSSTFVRKMSRANEAVHALDVRDVTTVADSRECQRASADLITFLMEHVDVLMEALDR